MHYKSPDNSLHSIDSAEYEHLLPTGSVQITDAEAATIRAATQAAAQAARTYSEKRVSEYPPIGDQLDALYKAGVFPAELAAQIKTVKDKFPKV